MPERPSRQFMGTRGKAERRRGDPPTPVSAVSFQLWHFHGTTIHTCPQMVKAVRADCNLAELCPSGHGSQPHQLACFSHPREVPRKKRVWL